MKTTTYFVLLLLLVASLPAFALDYTITFTGNGASTTVDNVVVQNLTRGTSVTVPSGNVLNLTDAVTSVEQLNATADFIRIFPNAVKGKSTVSFYAKQAGRTQINVFSLDGRKVAEKIDNLQTGVNSFQLSMPKGSYVIHVSGNGYSYTTKLMNQTATISKPEIVYFSTEKPTTFAPQKSRSSTLGTTTMAYSTGDHLLYKAVSGIYSTIITDKPTGSKTTNFGFIDCTDGDGNHYAVVTIGTQTWMAENLRTTRYRTGEIISTTTPATKDIMSENMPKYQWAYDGNETNVAKYGRLYTWYAATDNRNIAPTGWHVASDAEWTTLGNYLIANGYNYDGTTSGNKIAKSLAASSDWPSSIKTNVGTISNDLTKNNTSGFTALPCGSRSSNGEFWNIFNLGVWWSYPETSATNAWATALSYDENDMNRGVGPKNRAYSVRCVRD